MQYTCTLCDAFNGSSGSYNISLTTPMFESNLSLDHPVFVFFYHSSTIVRKYCCLLRSLNFLHHRSIRCLLFPLHLYYHVQYSSAYNLLLPDHLVKPFFSMRLLFLLLLQANLRCYFISCVLMTYNLFNSHS
jgi:hypothetical protein